VKNLFCLVMLGLLCTPSAATEDSRPNIVFFLADDQRVDFLSVTGHPVVRTPAIDQLAQEGTLFRNMTVTTSTCWVSRASILTGMRHEGHQYTYEERGTLESGWAQLSFSTRLRRAGYEFSYVGKNHIKYNQGDTEVMFDHYTPVFRNPYFKKQPDGTLKHTTDIIGDEAVAFLNQEHEKPFCLYLNFNAAHAEDNDKENHYPYPARFESLYKDSPMPLPKFQGEPYKKYHPEFLRDSMHGDRFLWRWDTPEKYQHNMRNYLRMISGIDSVVNRVRKELEALDLDKNTIIIYTADNGYYAANRDFAGKWTHYEESLRVPLIIRDPRVAEQTATNHAPVLNIDLPATILDMAGVDVPGYMSGKSLQTFLSKDSVKDWREDSLHSFKGFHATIPNWEGVRNKRYVYARYYDQSPPQEFLYDLEKDADQLNNLSLLPSHRKQLAALRKRCDELKADEFKRGQEALLSLKQ